MHQLCDRFPARRRLIIGLAYAGLTLTIVNWLVCVVVPAVAMIYLGHYSSLQIIGYWFGTLSGAPIFYLIAKELRKFRRSGGNNA